MHRRESLDVESLEFWMDSEPATKRDSVHTIAIVGPGHKPLNRKRSASFSSHPHRVNSYKPNMAPPRSTSQPSSRKRSLSIPTAVTIPPELYAPPTPTKQPLSEENRRESLTFKQRFKIFIEKSDLHGLPDWYEAQSKSMKLCWSFILIFSISMMVWELIGVAQDFRDNPILTTYALVDDGGGLDFPDVFLCPSNPIHKQAWLDANVYSDWEDENIKGLLKAQTNESGLSGLLAAKATVSESLAHMFPAGMRPPPQMPPPPQPQPKDAHEYFMKVGYPTKSFLKECAFNGLPLDCEELAKPIFDQDFGKCFLLRLHDKKQKIVGAGLSLVLSLDYQNGFPTGEYESPLYDGVIMKIGRRFDVAQQQYSLLYPGTFTRTSLEMTKMNLIQRERKNGGQNCVDAKTGRLRMKIINAGYSPGACRMDCVRQVGIKECGCHMPLDRRFLKNPKIKYCTPKQLSECVYPAIYAQQNDTIYNCAIHCRTPCTLYQYRADTSSARFPTFKFREANQQPPPPPFIIFPAPPSTTTGRPPTTAPWWTGPTPPPDPPTPTPPIPVPNSSSRPTPPPSSTSQQDVPTPSDDPQPPGTPDYSYQNDYYNYNWMWQEGNKLERAKEKVAELQQEDHIILDVSYSAMQYIEITQEPSMTATTFISNIGGQVGLWIGASNITIIKFFIILLPLMLSVFGGGRQPNDN